jgi:hypothetical protein
LLAVSGAAFNFMKAAPKQKAFIPTLLSEHFLQLLAK